MNRLLPVFAVVLLVAGGCAKKAAAPKQPAPSGKLVWTEKQGVMGGTTVDLKGNVARTEDYQYFCGSAVIVPNADAMVTLDLGLPTLPGDLGELPDGVSALTWEFVPNTRNFGSIILVRLHFKGSVIRDYLVKDGQYGVILDDADNKVDYVE